MRISDVKRIAGALSIALLSFPAAAQFEEVEPNNPCAAAQFIGPLPELPAVLTGELTLTGAEPPGDVDFFILQAPEGMRLRAGLRGDETSGPPLGDPFLGLFDAACNLIAVNDDYQGLNSRLTFEVPVGGTFILAASGCCDLNGYHGQQGMYRLRLSIPPEPVQAITGRLVDAVTNAPLPGTAPPFSAAELARCVQGDCTWSAGYAPADENGVFRFETDNYGAPLDPGQYLINAWGGEYAPVQVGPFQAASGEVVDLGEIPMQPPPYILENVVPCADISPSGGRCNYSVDVRNNTDTVVQGLGWSIVNAYGGTSPLGFTVFQADTTRHVQLRAFSTKTMRFSFDVPADVASGTSMCADAWFSDRTTDYFGTLRSQGLFCVMKQGSTYEVVDPKVAAGKLGIGAIADRPSNRRH